SSHGWPLLPCACRAYGKTSYPQISQINTARRHAGTKRLRQKNLGRKIAAISLELLCRQFRNRPGLNDTPGFVLSVHNVLAPVRLEQKETKSTKKARLSGIGCLNGKWRRSPFLEPTAGFLEDLALAFGEAGLALSADLGQNFIDLHFEVGRRRTL